MADMEMEDAAPMEGLEEEKEEGEEDAPVIVSERQPERAEDMRHGDAELRGAAGGRVGGREGVRQKGRGFAGGDQLYRPPYRRQHGGGTSYGDRRPAKPVKSVEGWVVFVSNVHEEAQEDDVYDMFADFGDIKSIHLNLDRRTGFVKGYCLLEYETQPEAKKAVEEAHGQELLGQKLAVDWAFVNR